MLQAAKLNADCLALQPPAHEAEKLQNEIRRIVKEAMVMPGEQPRRDSRDIFDVEAEISDAFHDRSGSLT